MINLTSTAAKRAYLLESIRESITFERGIYRRLTPLIDQQARHASKRYEETKDILETIRTVTLYDERWLMLLSWQHNRVGAHVGKKFFNSLKSERLYMETKSFDAFRAAFAAFVEDQSATQVMQIQDHTIRQIQAAIQSAINEGLTGYEISKEIYKKVSGIGRIKAKTRARLIARTETHTAQNHASQTAAETSGHPFDKEWLSAEDQRTREDHFNADGQKVDLKLPFIVGGEELMYPGDQNASPDQICNCRCDHSHVSRVSVVV